MKCWKCDRDADVGEKIGFRAICDHCGSWQHVCVNCHNYHVGKPNDCAIPGTEFVSDREKRNFCEEFGLKTKEKRSGPTKEDVARRLFGDE